MFRTSSSSRPEPITPSTERTKARQLVRDDKLSFGASDHGNAIIHGDNNETVDLLKTDLSHTIKCIYLDPPYNNKEAYNHYIDKDSHDEWLINTVKHIEKLCDLLEEAGSIWISIDDWQVHYLKVELDKVFGRDNFVSTIVWEHRKTRENRKVFSNNHEYILVYAKNILEFKKNRNLLPYNEEVLSRYKNPDNDPRGPWQSVSANAQAGHATKDQFYEIVAPNGRRYSPPNGRCWVYTEERIKKEIAKNNVWFGRDGNAVPRLKRFLRDAKGGLTPHTIWTAKEVGTTDHAKKHLLSLFPQRPVFDTPKPETLIQRIIEIASDEGDLVFDSYLGSGTTAAVAHKLGRRYIGIEIGDHAVTHCAERLRKLITGGKQFGRNGSDRQGAGGFDFYRLI